MLKECRDATNKLFRKVRKTLVNSKWLKVISVTMIVCMLCALVSCSKPKNESSIDSSSVQADDLESETMISSDLTESTDVTLSDITANNTSQTTSKNGTTVKTSSNSGTVKPSNGLPSDYKEFVFATSTHVHEYQSVGTSDRSDLIITKFKEVEDKYGIKIRVKTYSEGEAMITDIVTSVTAGLQPFDVLETHNARARQLMVQGVIKPQSDIKTINVKDSRFTQSVADNVTFKNKVYATTVGGVYKANMGVIYNKKVLKSLNLGENYIYDLYKSKKWTFETFRDLARKATKGSGDDKTWGVLGTTAPIGMAVSANAGGTVIRKSNGSFDIALASAGGIEAMNWVHELWATDKSFNYVPDNVSSWEVFAQGKTLLFPTWIDNINGIMEYGLYDEVGYVPFPIGPRQKDYITNAYEYDCFVMLTSLKYPEATGKVYMELSTVSSQLKALYETQLRDFGFDDKSIEAYKDIESHIQSEFSRGVPLSATGDIDSAVFTLNGDPASVAASMKKVMLTEVQDFYKKIS